MKEKILSLKEALLGDAGLLETILGLIVAGSIASLIIITWFTVTHNSGFLDAFLAKPLSNMTVGEFIIILFILGLIFRK